MTYKDLVKGMFVKERINENLVLTRKKMTSSDFDYQQLSNSNTGDVNVPKWFADTLVTGLTSVTNICDMSVGDGQLIISLLQQYPTVENVTICDSKIINLEAASARIKRDHDINIITILYTDFKDLTEKTKSMKFDVVATNPPFFGKGHPEHLKFLSLAYELSSKYVLFVQPSTYLVDNKKENQYYQYSRNLIKDHLVSCTLYTKDVFDGAQLNTGVAGIVVDKDTTVSSYNVKYNNLNRSVLFNDIEDINIFGDNTTYISIKNKILAAAKIKNLQDDIESQGSWCVPIPKLQRYRFLPNRARVTKTEDYDDNHAVYYTSEDLAKAAYDWMHDPVAILALHIYKQDMNIASGRNLRSVPSFNTVQDFKGAHKKIGLTQQEVDWCKDIYENSTNYIKFS